MFSNQRTMERQHSWAGSLPRCAPHPRRFGVVSAIVAGRSPASHLRVPAGLFRPLSPALRYTPCAGAAGRTPPGSQGAPLLVLLRPLSPPSAVDVSTGRQLWGNESSRRNCRLVIHECGLRLCSATSRLSLRCNFSLSLPFLCAAVLYIILTGPVSLIQY